MSQSTSRTRCAVSAVSVVLMPQNMQIVNFDYTGQGAQESSYSVLLDTLWHGIEPKIHRVPQQRPYADHDDEADGEADRRIGP